MIGKVEKYYHEKIESEGAMLFSLVDPDKFSFEKGAKLAKACYENGADVILVGGSIGAQGEVLDETVKQIKESVGVPVVLFPGNISGISGKADAIYFMQLLNSRDVYWLSTAAIQGAPVIKRLGLEAIPTTYLVFEPGRLVGWIGNANLIPVDRPDIAAACGLAARFSGSRVLISERGSGAPEPLPSMVVNALDKACGEDVFLFDAGGVRTAEQAGEIIKAGADGIQVGTVFEEGDVAEKTRLLRKAVKEAGKKRV
jgi:phosphoglycerol geranylgeranyltransferase